MKILVKFPTRERRKIFEACLKKWVGLQSPFHEVFYLFTLDSDDQSMKDWAVPPTLEGAAYWGDRVSKVEAVNRDMELAPEFDLLVLASDDMVPQKPNWDDLLVQALGDCMSVVHQNDGRQGENLNTFSVMRREIYERFGYIYHPDYLSLFADNEFTEVTRSWGVVSYTDQTIILHKWTDLTGHDSLHAVNSIPAVWNRDRMVYEHRQSKGFPKESVLKELGL